VSIFSSWFGNPIDEYVERFRDAMEAEGLSVRIGEIRRSEERQQELFAQGRTQPGPIVTWTLNSAHVTGRAFDFDFVDARDQGDPDAWLIAGEIGSGLGLRWLPYEGVPDFRHFELFD